jgi:putative Mg2+ transporter-C (MgtC) family protein
MLSVNQIVIRLLLASILGGVIGFERERLDWAAGLRTHMLVCVGAALAMIVSSFGFHDVLGQPNIVLDPSRIAAQVVSGIGFLGAGTIMFLRHEVIRGLTTAAGLWTVAAIGLTVGAGLYYTGIIATVIVLVVLAGLRPVERRFFRKRAGRRIVVSCSHEDGAVQDVMTALRDFGVEVASMVISRNADEGLDQIQLVFGRRLDPKTAMDLASALTKCDAVREVSTGESS